MDKEKLSLCEILVDIGRADNSIGQLMHKECYLDAAVGINKSIEKWIKAIVFCSGIKVSPGPLYKYTINVIQPLVSDQDYEKLFRLVTENNAMEVETLASVYINNLDTAFDLCKKMINNYLDVANICGELVDNCAFGRLNKHVLKDMRNFD